MKTLCLSTAAFLVFFFSQKGFAQEVSANPTRPSSSDNAYLTGNGYAEIETG